LEVILRVSDFNALSRRGLIRLRVVAVVCIDSVNEFVGLEALRRSKRAI